MDGPVMDRLVTDGHAPDAAPPCGQQHSADGVGRRHVGWLAVLALALLALALIDGPARHALGTVGWVDRDAPFTELYFPDHLALPEVATAGEPLAFQFSVRNREGTPRTYEWQVRTGPSGAPGSGDTIASGELRLGDDEVRVIDVPAVRLPAGDAVVTVALVGRPEAIHFPLVVEPAREEATATSP